MNPDLENKDPEAIRSDIEETRQRMDSTMDAIGERLHGRHLVDEVIGFFRSGTNDNSTAEHATTQIKEKAGAAVSSVVDTVKANPIPAILIGTGVAWMIYSATRNSSPASNGSNGRDNFITDEDFRSSGYDRPGEYLGGAGEFQGEGEELFGAGERRMSGNQGTGGGEGESLVGTNVHGFTDKLQQKASETRDIVQEKISRAREGAKNVAQRAGELGSQAQERAKMAYDQSREKVVTTAREHPLGLGIACLAIGIIAGLSLPTPQKLNQLAGPTADRLRQKAREAGRDVMERGRTVARAAADAVKNEAEKQGLTVEALKRKGQAVANAGQQAATNTAQDEDLAPAGASPGSSA